ncbi:hypothetical protein GIV38_27670 [Pseudomonas syringae]|nr:hypothetical protein [Pseudomonas syringae]
MWEAWVIRDISAKGKASEDAAAKCGWMNGWKNQKGLITGNEKPQKIRPKGYKKTRSR